MISVGVLLAGFVALFLATTAAISDAYQTAESEIFQSPAVVAHVGVPSRSVLVGSRQNLTSGLSCAELTFLVSGAEGFGAVQVNLHRQPRSAVWSVHEVIPGWFRQAEKSCAGQRQSGSLEPGRVSDPPIAAPLQHE